MVARPSVLWIDDGAIADLTELTGPVYASGRYSMKVVTNISDAILELHRTTFNVVIVDIRLPPGENAKWKALYMERGQNPASARLGLEFLISCLGTPQVPLEPSPMPETLQANRFAVLTVEEELVLKEDLERLKVKIHQQKDADMPRRTLIDLIERVRKNG